MARKTDKVNGSPYKVTAHLVSPLAGDPPQLDALLIFQQSRRRNVDRSRPAPRQEKGCIPIAREWLGDWYVSKCSSPIISPTRDNVNYYTRRMPVEHSSLLAPEKRRIIATGNSWTKSYRLPLRVRPIEKVVWFCMGNGAPLRHVLKKVDAIGKKVSYGYGVVSKWTVEPIDEDLSWFAEADGKRVLMRPLPLDMIADDVIGYRRDFGACVPPYWHPERYGDIVVPC